MRKNSKIFTLNLIYNLFILKVNFLFGGANESLHAIFYKAAMTQLNKIVVKNIYCAFLDIYNSKCSTTLSRHLKIY